MNSSPRMLCVAVAISIAGGPVSGKTARKVASEQTLSIHLYDRAEVPVSVLHSATAEATRIFKTAGIGINWHPASAEPPEDVGLDMSSAIPRNPDKRHYLVVRIVRRMPANVFPGALAFSLPFARSGAHVCIFYDRMENSAQSVNTALYVALGHMMAHEIGHVLLRSSEHAIGGLMQARWGPTTWRLASAGLLAFRPEEAERMGTGLGRFPENERTPAPFPPRRSPE